MFKSRMTAEVANARVAQGAAALRRIVERHNGAAEHTSSQGGPAWLRYVPESVRGVVASSLPANLQGVPDWVGRGGFGPAASDETAADNEAAAASGSRFLSKSFTNAAGTRPYKLYVPSGYDGRPVPLIVMLHGCTQSPDDFAAGTGMNEAAEKRNFLVAYPGQIRDAHAQKCWKWFSAEDQQRDQGEPFLLAGITRQVMQNYAVDPRRVYVAGMSAGGAAAAILGDAYPELYAAIGVHSGLACGSAHDVPSALAAMKRGGEGRRSRSIGPDRVVPVIVFHGDRDATVNSHNGDNVMAQAVRGAGLRQDVQSGRSAGGQDYTRTTHSDVAGQVVAEQWVVHGAGHAWSGGRLGASYTNPHGPDATREMVRFFEQHPQP